MKKKTIFLGIVILVIFLFFKNRENLNIFFIEFFKENVTIRHYNNSGKLDGAYISYIDGIIRVRACFKNGLINGDVVRYYSNGKVKSILPYKNGKAEGEEKHYFENGILNYKDFFRNDRHYGSYFEYSEEGKLTLYATYDINERSFCIYNYDREGNITKSKGMLISPVIFSIDVNTDSVIVLKNDSKIRNDRDLYMTVASPPGLKSKFNISINNKPITNYKIIENTIVIKNAFLYKAGYLLDFYWESIDDKNNKMQSPTFEYQIFAE